MLRTDPHEYCISGSFGVWKSMIRMKFYDPHAGVSGLSPSIFLHYLPPLTHEDREDHKDHADQ